MALAELDPSQIATLSLSSTTPSLFQLTGGGAAILSAPSAPLLSGKLLKLVVVGRAQILSGGASPAMTLYLGTSTSSPVLLNIPGVALGTSSGSGNLINNFAVEVDISWDSVAEQVIQIGSSTSLYPIAAQSDIQFCLSGYKASGGETNSTLTITEFKLKKV